MGFIWSMTWIIMYSCHRVIVVASYNKKTKIFTLSAGGKNKTSGRGVRLSEPDDYFPVLLYVRDHGWKLHVGYDQQVNEFTLLVNSKPFPQLPY